MTGFNFRFYTGKCKGKTPHAVYVEVEGKHYMYGQKFSTEVAAITRRDILANRAIAAAHEGQFPIDLNHWVYLF